MLAQRCATWLLLDEPTNHLDVASLEVLEARAGGLAGARSSPRPTTAGCGPACGLNRDIAL